MARFLVVSMIATVVGVLVDGAISAHAQEVSEDVATVADEAAVDPIDLLGAMSSTHLGAREYLCAADGLLCPVAAPRGYLARVRLTYYVLTGRTYSGVRPYIGSTACSWNWRIGQRFVFRDGERVICTDRGLLGNVGWLDIWGQPALVRKYAAYAEVEVLDP